jgi:hypothetical protein
MTILAHRGFWKDRAEMNTQIAFSRAFDNGFGVETDIRDCSGELVVAHDMPNGREMKLVDFFELLDGRPLEIAFNIKADGLYEELKKLIQRYEVKNFFTFDMSFPESLRFVRQNLKPLISLSEYNPSADKFGEYFGVWLDAFKDESWYSTKNIRSWVSQFGKIAIVSPELHNRHHADLWRRIKIDCSDILERVSLCTDFPDQADVFFNGGKSD